MDSLLDLDVRSLSKLHLFLLSGHQHPRQAHFFRKSSWQAHSVQAAPRKGLCYFQLKNKWALGWLCVWDAPGVLLSAWQGQCGEHRSRGGHCRLQTRGVTGSPSDRLRCWLWLESELPSSEWRPMRPARPLWNSAKERLKALGYFEGKVVACRNHTELARVDRLCRRPPPWASPLPLFLILP